MFEQNNIYRTALDTLKISRNSILAAVGIYVVAAVAGWVYSDNLAFMEDQFQELARRFENLSPVAFVFRIFMHNLIASYLAMCFVTLFGLIPLALAAFNGLMVGWFAGWLEHVSWFGLAVFLAPHGIFEWPAMFIAFGVGMWRGVAHFFGPVDQSWGQLWKKAHCVYFVFVVPLLFIAAMIEGRYHFMQMFS